MCEDKEFEEEIDNDLHTAMNILDDTECEFCSKKYKMWYNCTHCKNSAATQVLYALRNKSIENETYRKQLNSAFKEGFIHKDKIKEIINANLTKYPDDHPLFKGYNINHNDCCNLARALIEFIDKEDK